MYALSTQQTTRHRATMSQSSVTTASNGSPSDTPISSPTSPLPDRRLAPPSGLTNWTSIRWTDAGLHLDEMIKVSDGPISQKGYAKEVMKYVAAAIAGDLGMRRPSLGERSGTGEQWEDELTARSKRSAPKTQKELEERLASVQTLSKTLTGLQLVLAGAVKISDGTNLSEESDESVGYAKVLLKNSLSRVPQLNPIRVALLEESGPIVDRILQWSEGQQALVTAFREQMEVMELVNVIVEGHAEMVERQLSQQPLQSSQNEPTESLATTSRGFSFRNLKQQLSDGIKELVGPKSGTANEPTSSLTR